MKKFSFVFFLLSLLIYVLLYYQLDYRFSFVVAVALVCFSFTLIIFFERFYQKTAKESAAKIVDDAKEDAKRLISEADANIVKIRATLELYKDSLNLKEQNLIERDNMLNEKEDKWKVLLAHYELKFHKYKEFVVKIRKIFENKNRDDKSKVQEMLRRLYNFKE